MGKKGPIIIIEDNPDERLLYEKAFDRLNIKNKIVMLENGKQAYDFLQEEKEAPFLIICDMKMPKMDGLELRQQIYNNPYLKKKTIPFVFRSGAANYEDINKAFELTVQGFFEKVSTYEKFEKQLKIILDYWSEGLEPNTVL